MVTGQLGVIGVHVVSHVDQAYVYVRENVLILNLNTVVMNVQEWTSNLRIVMRENYVQV